MTFRIIQGDNRDVLKTIEDNSIDSIVTDPPYGIDFLGKEWDANTGALETYQECLRVLKPGGHILAFSAARTYHHLAITLEQAGFEIRDQIMWIYSSGFPKSQDIGKSIQRSLGVKKTKKLKSNGPSNGLARMTFNQSEPAKYKETKDKQDIVVTDPVAKQWEGWGTALKPAHEPICLARKPMKTSIAQNCQKYGTGALNIDACRVGDEPIKTVIKRSEDNSRWYKHSQEGENIPKVVAEEINQGRFPSNVLGEIPDYQKYFYCPKVSRAERHMGFDNVESQVEMLQSIGGYLIDDDGKPTNSGNQAFVPGHGIIYTHGINALVKQIRGTDTSNSGNNHPTVKPVALMEYLIKLITPPGGTVLDPFNGSGSTGMAAVGLGYNYIGIELDPAYVEIAKKRIEAWANKDALDNNFEDLFSAT